MIVLAVIFSVFLLGLRISYLLGVTSTVLIYKSEQEIRGSESVTT